MSDSQKEDIRRKRASALALRLGIGPNDKIMEVISRQDGLYAITLEKIIRVNLPEQTDPDLEHADAPIIQTMIVPFGTRNPLVARTILQADDFAKWLPTKEMESSFVNVAWQVMFSLIGLNRIISRITSSIEDIKPAFPG